MGSVELPKPGGCSVGHDRPAVAGEDSDHLGLLEGRRVARWRNILAVLTILALAGFAWYPLMPPRLMPSSYGFVDTAARYGGMGIFDKGSMKDVENLYAAMPSLHIGWSTWSAAALFPAVNRRWVKALVCIDPLLTFFAIVVTANHWVLDAVAGLLWLGTAYLIVTLITRVWFPADESERRPWRWSLRPAPAGGLRR